jgi:hypothetical protein
MCAHYRTTSHNTGDCWGKKRSYDDDDTKKIEIKGEKIYASTVRPAGIDKIHVQLKRVGSLQKRDIETK